MSTLPDPIQEGLAKGWRVVDAASGKLPVQLDCDVLVIGTGAGAGVSADLLTKAGLNVILVEEGDLKSSRNFNQLESEAYPQLYQESAARKTKDKAITILQGRTVGGSTTVNWTSSFRTPESTLQFWQERFGLKTLSSTFLAPYFEQVERRLNIAPWAVPANENNDVLARGAAKLGIETGVIARNVKGCWNLGSCGLGCPTNAKQSMLLTTIPASLERGARLFIRTRAFQFVFEPASASRTQRIAYLSAHAVTDNGQRMTGNGFETQIRAKHYILAGGAIQSPALLLRSAAPDPHHLLGTRTFLHPTVVSAARMPKVVAPWAGAPQSIYSDHFLKTQALDGALGYKLEAAPVHPVLFASTITGQGQDLAGLAKHFPESQVMLALMRDGFHPRSVGGSVGLREDGSPVLDYPVDILLLDAARRALLTMAEIQFAGGAKAVLPLAENAVQYNNWAEAKTAIQSLPLSSPSLKVVSAHVMGGCNMAAEERLGVSRPDGRHWQIDNLSVHDGSLFPTSIGANPQLSIYGLVNYLTQNLIKSTLTSNGDIAGVRLDLP